jgi:hypothetical protein
MKEYTAVKFLATVYTTIFIIFCLLLDDNPNGFTEHVSGGIST